MKIPVWLSSLGGLFFSAEDMGGGSLGEREGKKRAGGTRGREKLSGYVI